MTITTVSAPPDPPRRQSMTPAEFSAAADAFVAWMETFGDELGVSIPEMNVDIAAAVAAGAAASASATAADTSADAAQAAYAALVVGDASASSGTSSTSTAIGTGAKSFTASTGKLWYVGMALILRSAADAGNYMQGLVTAYNVGTGALDVNVLTVGGSGTLADWQIFPVAAAGASGLTQIGSTINTTSAALWTFSSIPSTYSELLLVIAGFSHNDGSTRTLTLELSDDNSNWTSTNSIYIEYTGAIANSNTVFGAVSIPGYTQAGGILTVGAYHFASDRAAQRAAGTALVGYQNNAWRVDAGITAVRVRLSGGSGDAGTLKLFGRS